MEGLRRFLDIKSTEIVRVGIITSLLFFLVGANNLIKILRDSIFLGHHPVSELPYLYISVAVIAGIVIATYTRFTARISLVRLIVATNAVILSNIVGFWVLLTFFDPGWSHYAFYIWSAMVSVIALSQIWTLANQLFNLDEGKRLFGLLTAGGTLGGAAAGLAAKWSIHLLLETNHLLWIVAALYLLVSALVLYSQKWLHASGTEDGLQSNKPSAEMPVGLFAALRSSKYIETIGVIIFASVIVSTLIDFSFKTAAKETYASRIALAAFFSDYYVWLSVATLFTQAVLTRKAITKLGFHSSLYVMPFALSVGTVSIMIWPSLATNALTRIADATLRNSIHRSAMEITYMAVPLEVMRRIKTFLDVVVERVGDASAGFIILLLTFSGGKYLSYVHFLCLALIIVWIALIPFLQIGYSRAFRKGLVPPEPRLSDEWVASSRTKGSLCD